MRHLRRIDPDEDRIKQLIVSLDLLLAVLNGRVGLADLDLPPDARVVHAQTDFARRGLALLIQSAAFDPVPIGELPPYLPPLRTEDRDR